MTSTLLTELRPDGTFVLTLNRPERLNAITATLRQEFSDALNDASSRTDVLALIVTGAGRAFCAGADLKEGGRSHPDRVTRARAMTTFHAEFAGALRAFPKPTVTLVNGPPAGGGLGLALAAGIRIASPEAILVTAFAPLGLPGDDGVTYSLVRAVGEAKALELLLLSPRISADEACRLGLVMEVVPRSELTSRGADVCVELSRCRF